MRENNKHMVLDADGLYIVTKNLDLVKGYKNCILTPNKNEFARLAKELGVNLEDKDRSDAVRLAAVWALGSFMRTLCWDVRCKLHYLEEGNYVDRRFAVHKAPALVVVNLAVCVLFFMNCRDLDPAHTA